MKEANALAYYDTATMLMNKKAGGYRGKWGGGGGNV